jgi:hypothetical protein
MRQNKLQRFQCTLQKRNPFTSPFIPQGATEKITRRTVQGFMDVTICLPGGQRGCVSNESDGLMAIAFCGRILTGQFPGRLAGEEWIRFAR